MKFLSFIFSIALFSIAASAQVSVEVSLEQGQEQFLPSEPIPLVVKIVNRSGRALHLGTEPDWLTFSVESADGFIIVKKSDVPVLGAFDLGSAETKIKRMNIEPYFGLARPGLYRITATLHIKDWNSEVTSAARRFDIATGAKLWSQVFGLPSAGNGAPEVRKYTLQKANYLRSQLRLYVSVSDESETRIFKITAIGPMVSFSRPEAQMDRFSNLHVLYQTGAQSFNYSVVNPNGDLTRQEIYDYLDRLPRPRLGLDTNSDIVVVGGMRRVKPAEVPAVNAPSELPAPKP